MIIGDEKMPRARETISAKGLEGAPSCVGDWERGREEKGAGVHGVEIYPTMRFPRGELGGK